MIVPLVFDCAREKVSGVFSTTSEDIVIVKTSTYRDDTVNDIHVDTGADADVERQFRL